MTRTPSTGAAALLAGIALAALLGGCGKKEEAAPPASTVVPAPEAAAPAPAPAPAPEAAAPAPAPSEQAAPAGGAAPTAMDAEAEMKKSDCFACHAVDKKLVGPAYSWIAYRYKGDKAAVQTLMDKVKKGGAGNWNAYTGGAPMTPHPQLSDDQLKAMVEWVLSRPPVEAPKP
jgi:cytochrome c